MQHVQTEYGQLGDTNHNNIMCNYNYVHANKQSITLKKKQHTNYHFLVGLKLDRTNCRSLFLGNPDDNDVSSSVIQCVYICNDKITEIYVYMKLSMCMCLGGQ